MILMSITLIGVIMDEQMMIHEVLVRSGHIKEG
jgi:hypothetical protein